MKNKEKYFDKIIDSIFDGECDEFIEPYVLIPNGVKCSEVDCDTCRRMAKEFFEKEYEEPKICWEKVEVDTPILVRGNETSAWIKRHFAKYENGMVFAWDLGKTSYTAGKYGCSRWNYAKLYEGEE